MSNHRSTQDRVTNKTEIDNFDAHDALESLHAAILQAETLAQVASEAVDRLRCPSRRAERRVFTRMQILVDKAAEEIGAALEHGDQLMAAVTRSIRAREQD